MARVGVFDSPVFREHDAGPGHPERPERVDLVHRGVRAAAGDRGLEWLLPRAVTDGELRRVHTAPHVAAVAATAGKTVRFDADTQAGPRSYEAALHAAGAVVQAMDGLLDGTL